METQIADFEKSLGQKEKFNPEEALKKLKGAMADFFVKDLEPILEYGQSINDKIFSIVIEFTKNGDKFSHEKELKVIEKKCAEIEKENKVIRSKISDPGTSPLKRKLLKKELRSNNKKMDRFVEEITRWEKEIDTEVVKILDVRDKLEPIYLSLKNMENQHLKLTFKELLLTISFILFRYLGFIILFVLAIFIDYSSNGTEEIFASYNIKDLHILILFLFFVFQAFVIDRFIDTWKNKLLWFEFKVNLNYLKQGHNAYVEFKEELKKLGLDSNTSVLDDFLSKKTYG